MEQKFYDVLGIIRDGGNWSSLFDWHSPLYDYSVGIVLVSLRVGNTDKYAYYDIVHKCYLVDESFDMGKPFVRGGYVQVKKGDRYNILYLDGSYLFDDWVYWVDKSIWNDGYFLVQYDDGDDYVLVNKSDIV